MTELGTQRDQSANENTKLDEHIIDLNLQKNMVNCFDSYFLVFQNRLF